MSDIASSASACLKPDADGCELLLHVVPNARTTVVVGLHDGALRLRLAAPATQGQANAALLRWLAQSLGVPKRCVRLVSGQSNRRKRVHLDQTPAAVAAWLHAQLAAADDASVA
jgi:uncharacterized protein (TIGR00251 family)